jgi:predicted DNA-binding transcriptional regulator AlpA
MLTMRQVLDATGVSYAVAYRHIRKGLVRFTKSDNSEIYIDARDVVKIEKRSFKAVKDKVRVSVWLSIDPARYEAWKIAAGVSNMREWIGGLADGAAGVQTVVPEAPVVISESA